MDEENRLVPVQVTRALADADTATLTPVAVDELTTKVVAALDRIAAIIPDLRTPHPATEKKVQTRDWGQAFFLRCSPQDIDSAAHEVAASQLTHTRSSGNEERRPDPNGCALNQIFD